MVGVEAVHAPLQELADHALVLGVPPEDPPTEAAVQRDPSRVPLAVVEVDRLDPGPSQVGGVPLTPLGEVTDEGRVDQSHLGSRRPPRRKDLEVLVAEQEAVGCSVPAGDGDERVERCRVLDVDRQWQVRAHTLVELRQARDVIGQVGRGGRRNGPPSQPGPHHAVVVDEREVNPTNTKRESDEIDRLLMSEAQASAKKSALERLGYTVTETGAGAFVRNVVPGAPADGRLQRGDVITAVNGTSVATSDAMADIIRAQAPGSTVVFTVERNDQVSTIEVPTVANEAGTTVVGIVTLTADPGYDYPFDVEITSGDVSGPSAGLAFSLGIIDELTPGDLTGGMRVAVTGTIDGEGRVGPIGSAREKAITAKQGRAQLMLVPVENLEDARSAGVDIEIVPVATLDDALAALAARGGAPVPNP